jgi:transcriptional regulator GlxA family with amidase domain
MKRSALSLLVMVLLCNVSLRSQQPSTPPKSPSGEFHAPAKERLNVAFILSDDAVTIDFAGPWEVFKDVFIPERGKTLAEQAAFRLYTVSDAKAPVRTSGGMQIVPDYTFDDAPKPDIVVVPAQRGRSPRMMAWIRQMSTQSQVLMSVCTGAEVLGDAGVLDGKKATTHHLYYDEFAKAYPKVDLQRDVRFVRSDPIIFTSAGLSSGIDLALHIVSLYFGDAQADHTAKIMEYEGVDWKGDGTIRPGAGGSR